MSTSDRACANCGALNPSDYDFCFACRVPAGTVNVHEADDRGNHVATGEVLEGAKASRHAATREHQRALAHPASASPSADEPRAKRKEPLARNRRANAKKKKREA